MNLVKIEISQASPEPCPLNLQNCVGCKYNISLGILNFSKSVYVVCGYEEDKK